MKIKIIKIGIGITAMAASAFCFLMYMGNGIAHGALVGREGREQDLQVTSVRAYWAFIFALGFQLAAITITMLSLRSESPTDALERLVITLWQLVRSTVFSILGTVFIFWLLLKAGKVIGF